MPAPILTIARFTVVEARRNRLAWLAVLAALAGLGLAAFLGELALTESRATQAVLAGAFYRFAAVFLLAVFVTTSLMREFHDKVHELVLALPVTRTAYCLGKLAGFGAVALAFAALFALPLLLFAAPGQVALWGASLGVELLIVAGLGLLCAFTFGNAAASLGAVFAFYLLARAIAALQLLAHGGGPHASAYQKLMAGFFDALALFLPRLDLYARGEWLAYGGGSLSELWPLVGQGAIYVALLGAAALFDFHRKNL